jgi:hypothetical protein
MDGKARALCSQQVPGDTQRNLQVDADYSAQTFKHVLVPIWLLAYTYGHTTYQVVINGFTGRIAGKRPYSWVKIFFAVMLALFILIIFAWLKGNSR